MKLRINGLPASMNTPALMDLLDPFPGVIAAWVVRDRINDKSKRYGIILVERPNDGLLIRDHLDGRSLEDGKFLQVIKMEVRPQ